MAIVPATIKWRLRLWFFTFISVLLIVFGFYMYYKVKSVIFISIDHTLHSKVQIILGLIHREKDNKIDMELSEDIAGGYAVPRSGQYYKIILGGKVLFASKSLTDDNFDLSKGTAEYYDEVLGESIYTSTGPAKEPIRILRHDQFFYGEPMQVFVAEGIRSNLLLLKRLRLSLLFTIPVTILIGGIVGAWIAGKSLNPLKVFTSKVDRITYKNLNERLDAGTNVLELDKLATSFNEMLDRLQNAFEAERRLISDASHELKTPVSVIKSNCDVLLQKERPAEEYIEALRTIKSVTENMADKIKAMLSLARLDSGLLHAANFEVISVNDCIEAAVGLCSVLARQKRVSIKNRAETGLRVLGDQERLTEALVNIIKNAVVYNKDNGLIEVSASRANNHIKILIKDTGMGIKKADIEKIFGRFYRADASRSSEGTGLGLNIAKAIIEAHSGGISASSEFGKGSCFTIALPSA